MRRQAVREILAAAKATCDVDQKGTPGDVFVQSLTFEQCATLLNVDAYNTDIMNEVKWRFITCSAQFSLLDWIAQFSAVFLLGLPDPVTHCQPFLCYTELVNAIGMCPHQLSKPLPRLLKKAVPVSHS